MTESQRAEFVDQVVESYASGRSIRQIAIATGRTYTTVRAALVGAGVQMRQRGSLPRTSPNP